jgi:hypothetical protein
MGLNFCIISGINYLAKAITMYESLVATGVDFNFYYVAFDKETFKCLERLNYKHIIPIHLRDIEDDQLKSIKKKRKVNEYYFTLTPSIILYIIKEFELDQCIYLDADLYFFQSPEILLQEMHENSVMLTKHHPAIDIVYPEGKFCVQFLPFKNDKYGIEILEWWRDRCIEWCFVRAEKGKWADQGYLNDWPERFNNVHVLEHFGAVGPWNIKTTGKFFDLISIKNKPYGKVFITGEKFPIVFYHFQGLRIQHNGEVMFASFEVDKSFKGLIYEPYIRHLLKVDSDIIMIFPGLNALGKIPKAKTIKSIRHIFKNEKTLNNFIQIIAQKVRSKMPF